MKILCVSDQIDPLVYSSSIKERFSDVELVLCAGDLPLDYLDFIMSSVNKPLYFVFGNHYTDKMKYYKGVWGSRDYPGCDAVHLGSKVRNGESFIVAGLGGTKRFTKGENLYSEPEMFFQAVKLIPRLLLNRIFHGRFLDILLTHAPPRGINYKEGKHKPGFIIFLWFMKIFKPRYLVHGHIHLYDLSDARCTKWEKTTVINAYSHYVIDTEI